MTALLFLLAMVVIGPVVIVCTGRWHRRAPIVEPDLANLRHALDPGTRA